MEKTKRTGSGYVSIRTGTEGPAYDPYSWTEYTVKRNRKETTLHMGLGFWMEITSGRRIEPTRRRSEKAVVEQFEKRIGISLKALEKAIDHVPKCCSKMAPEEHPGFPGEHFTICANCGEHLDYYFNIGEVE